MKEEWKKVKLGEIYEVHNGLSKGGKFFGFGYPFLSFSTIFNNWFIPETIKDLVQSTEVERANFSVKAGDVFITRTSETADELGMSCVALKDYPNATYNGFCKRLRPIESDYSLNYKYIGYYLRTKSFRNNFLGLSGAMTTRASLKNDDLLAMEITLPPLPTQQKIASVLSAYDDLIENNRKQIKLLEEAALKLYKEWFVKLNFPGHETTKIADGVPDGWKKGTLNEFGTIITGKTPSTKNENYYGGDIPFVKIPDMHKGIFTIKTEEYLTIEGANTQKNKFIPSESLIVSCIGTAGLVNIAYEECQTNQQINSIVCTKKENVYYLYYFLKSQKEYLNALGSNGATMVNVNKEKFGNVEVLIPNDKILERFAVITKPFFNKIKNCQLSIVNLQLARDKLLPKLMNGEIEV